MGFNGQSPMRLVVVEDHPLILNMLTLALSAVPGYQVVPCETAQAGLDACREPTDLAIFDNHLPDMAGIDAVRLLRADPRTLHLPVIMITADADRQTRMAAVGAGANDFLEKPVQVDELRLRVRNLLALHLAQKDATERQALLQTLIAASGASLAVADARAPGAPVLYASEPLLARAGATAEGVLGHAIGLLWAGCPASAGREGLEQAIAARGAGRFLLASKPATGGRAWAEVALTPVADGNGSARYLVAAVNDVTDLVLTRQAHARLSSRLGDIAKISGAWFFEIDASLNLTYISEAMALAMTGRADGFAGLNLADLPVRLADPHRAGTPLPALFGPPHAPVLHELLSARMPDGSLRSIQISATPFHDEQGRFAGYRGHAGDVSEIIRARDQAARANRAKSVFLATMSHEMRTPLTAIIGLSEMAADLDAPAAFKSHLAEISTAATALSGVLSDVLDVAAMERGALVLNAAPFDPKSEAERILNPLRAKAEAAGLTLELNITPARAPRLGDGARFSTILRALASNAVKFTPQGKVRVDLDLGDPGAVRLCVSDTGIGMSVEEQTQVLEPFVQADDGIARRYGGTGLGLSMATWLTRAMGGQFSLQSDPGLGTRVQVTLPLPLAAPPPHPAPGLEGARVLVADDNQTNRRILQAMLAKMGARITLCEDGPEALEKWHKGAFDLVLLDINMPGMAGTEVIAAIRRGEAARGARPVPAVAVTANARPEQVLEYRKLGFDDCVSKPFTSAGLANALSRHVTALAPAPESLARFTGN